ncbi:MAG: mechanosensitive ion channel family protein [Nitrospinae bacterium]|nr:mechanosensitive ion channel family protein [Nitrospinota bacterium]
MTYDYAIAALIVLMGGAAVLSVSYLLKRREVDAALRGLHAAAMIHALRENVAPLLFFAVVYAAVKSLSIPRIERPVDIAAAAFLAFYGARFVTQAASAVISGRWEGEAQSAAPGALVTAVKIVVWGLALIFLLNNLGFNVSALVAGLGVGGVALALASQAVLGDLFSYFVILFDKPFEVGDSITFGETSGVVEKVGVKTTRVRSVSGEEVVISNTALIGSRLSNFKRMERRRAFFRIGVTYQTGREKVARIPELIERIVKSEPKTTFERAHLAELGESAIVFETGFYVETPDYGEYMNVRQRVNLKIMEEFEKLGIQFAYPTRTVHVDRAGAE